MPERTQVSLSPELIDVRNPTFRDICSWQFSDSYVSRLLSQDIPQRINLYGTALFVYKDNQGVFVGFGSIEISSEYRQISRGLSYPYIPLLAVNPSKLGLGHGNTIVEHLIEMASQSVKRYKGLQDSIYLDVYVDNTAGICLHKKHGFSMILEREFDPDEGQYYHIMARRVPRSPVSTP